MGSQTNGQAGNNKELLYLDILRCVGIIGVVGVHYLMDLKISPTNFLPSSEGIYENLSDLIAYKEPSNSLTTISMQALQLILKFGWQAVHIFLFVSGFGLYLSYLKSSSKSSWLKWMKRRLNRILPKYWVVVTIILAVKMTFALYDWLSGQESISRLAILPVQYLMSVSLIRSLTQVSFYSLAGALWYIPLIIGLYLCFPPLIKVLKQHKISFPSLLFLTTLISLIFRFIINIDPCATPIPFQINDACAVWNLHTIFSVHVLYGLFIGRLPEFVLGMYAAHLYINGSLDRLFIKFRYRLYYLVIGISIWILGNISSYYKASWPLCDLLITVGLTAMFAALFYRKNYYLNKYITAGIQWLSLISYEIFLVHQTTFFLLDRLISPTDWGYTLFFCLYSAITIASSLAIYFSCKNLTIDSFPLVNLIEQKIYKLIPKQT